MKTYKFSIITTTLNSERFLERCLKSVKNQSYQNFEHILIDGISTDNTMKIISDNRSHFSKIISEKDDGIWDAMNKGLNLATGDIICFLNSDDFYNIDALKIANKYFVENNIDFLFGSVKKYKLMHGYRPWMIKWSFGFYTSHSIGFFIKKNSHLKVGFYDKKFLSADLDFFYKMIVRDKLKGMSTKKNEIMGIFEKGGFSSKVNYLIHLRDLNQIRIANKENVIKVYIIYFFKIIKKPLKYLLAYYQLKKKLKNL